MAKERGWWKLDTTVEPNEMDLEHIAELIKQGYTEGEIVADEEEIKLEPGCAGCGMSFITKTPCSWHNFGAKDRQNGSEQR